MEAMPTYLKLVGWKVSLEIAWSNIQVLEVLVKASCAFFSVKKAKKKKNE